MSEQERGAQRLKDKVAIVTGGGGENSIGRAISLRYGAEGAKVAVLDINADGSYAGRGGDHGRGRSGHVRPL